MSDIQSLTIENAARAKLSFVECLARDGRLSINLSDLADLDLSGIQLLIAVFREAEKERKEVHLTGSPNGLVLSRFVAAGMCDGSVATGENIEQAIKAV
jgi:STAS domain.